MAPKMNSDAQTAFAKRADEGPVVMLNLLKFKPEGAALYAKYGAAVTPLLEKVGATVEYIGAAEPALIGDDWDQVVLVRYPTRGALMQMASSAAYQAISHLRTDSLERAALIPIEAQEKLMGHR